MKIRIDIHAPAPPDALAVVDAGLDEYNALHSALHEVRPLHVVATDSLGTIVGGAIGRSWGKCCELQQLWVNADHRAQGQGTALMDAFEREASSRGCELAYLDTFSFQSPAFYANRGYTEVLRTDGFTGGASKITMQKRLVAGSTDHAQGR